MSDARSLLDDANILVTGGTGSFGNRFIRTLLSEYSPRRVVVFSRDEAKQYLMRRAIEDPRVRFFLGDVRDLDRARRSFEGIDIVIHAAALKHVPITEYNPFEAVRTNVLGAQNVIDAAIDCGVRRIIALSTDKASSPINLYGATKLVSDKLFVSGNVYAGNRETRFAVVRYGNVAGSRGSVVPLFRELAKGGEIPITDPRMTRFWITLDQGVRFVVDSLVRMSGGEIFVPKIPSMRVVDLARAIAPDASQRTVGIRPGEKLHEEMISVDDARRTTDEGDHYVIRPYARSWSGPPHAPGPLLPAGFSYQSDTNSEWLDVEALRETLVDV